MSQLHITPEASSAHWHEADLVFLLPGNSNQYTVAHSVEAQSLQETGHLLVILHSLAKRNESKQSGWEFVFPEIAWTWRKKHGFVVICMHKTLKAASSRTCLNSCNKALPSEFCTAPIQHVAPKQVQLHYCWFLPWIYTAVKLEAEHCLAW